MEEVWLQKAIATFEKSDDVLRTEFLDGVIFASPSKLDIASSAKKWLQSRGTTWVEVLDTAKMVSNLSQGCYCVSEKQLHEICKLYDDLQGAFLVSFVPGSDW